MSLPQLSTLLVLGEGAALSNADLARRTFVSPQASHKVTSELLKRGLVSAEPDRNDARQLLVSLTSDGTATLARCVSAVAEV
ncbi:MarR family transcriptional regulator, partial [Rhizobium johnstonii]|uniref:MarR family transcriptional regulator n=1 Tax=Rhizobium johnstonii TaxID=3019933 RepID=UPI003F9840B3